MAGLAPARSACNVPRPKNHGPCSIAAFGRPLRALPSPRLSRETGVLARLKLPYYGIYRDWE